MKILKPPLIVFQFIGLWRPVNWESGWRRIYNAYTCLVLFLTATFTVSQIIELCRSLNDIERLVNNSFLTLSLVGICGKAFSMVIQKDRLVELIRVLEEDSCRPRNDEEFAIQEQHYRIVRMNVLWFITLGGVTTTALTLKSIVHDMREQTLPIPAWLPYHYNASKSRFMIAYCQQFVSFTIGGLIGSAFDVLVPGLMIQACAQINLLKHRIIAIPETLERMVGSNKLSDDEDFEDRPLNDQQSLQSMLLIDCIEHHIKIIEFAKTANKTFSRVVFLQFAVSFVSLCGCILQLSRMKAIDSIFMAAVMYLTSLLVEICFFCFYGSELMAQSTDISWAIYQTEWTRLDIRTQKSLIMMMMRSLRPIQFTCATVIILSIDSLKSLLKFSYSAFNVLQQSA